MHSCLIVRQYKGFLSCAPMPFLMCVPSPIGGIGSRLYDELLSSKDAKLHLLNVSFRINNLFPEIPYQELLATYWPRLVHIFPPYINHWSRQ